MSESQNQKLSDMASLSERTIRLIFDGRYDEAETMIEDARNRFPADEHHRLISLAATLRNEMGNTHESVRLMQEAVREKPTWLPHLYHLGVFLMDGERWLEANAALDELIRLSEHQNDFYFLDDALFRKIMCLKSLGRFEEIPAQKAKITPNAEVFIGNKRFGMSDL